MDIHTPGTASPGMYCRKCGYALVGLSEDRCPECGRAFDPANPRTFRRKPLLSGVRLWLVRLALATAALVAGLLIVEGSVAGWYYRGWRAEQEALAPIRQVTANVIRTTVTGPRWCHRLLSASRLLFLTERVYDIELVDMNVTDSLLRQLQGLPNLGGVGLIRSTICKDGLRRLEGIRHLRMLTLVDCPLDEAGLEHLKDLPDLRLFYLMNDKGPDYRFLADLKQVERVWLFVPAEDGDMRYVGRMTNLRDLKVHRWAITDAGLAHLAGLTQLRNLDLEGMAITAAGLAHLQGMSKLETLNLQSTRVTDEGLVYLKGLTNLQMLYLGGTRITDAGMSHLSGLPRLRTLSLSGTGVCDAGLVALSSLPALEDLDLSETQVTNKGLDSLKALAGLRTLRLNRTSVTAEGVDLLKTRSPMLTVYWLAR